MKKFTLPTYRTFSNNPETLSFSKSKREMIKKHEEHGIRFEYFTGVAYRLEGYKEHECDCPYCSLDEEGEVISELFISEEEAVEYIEDYSILEPKITEEGYYLKAVRQDDDLSNLPLFKEVV